MYYFHRKILFLIAGIFLLAMYACEFDSDKKNYHNLTPPENDVKVNYNLADIPVGNTIYIYAPTTLNYNINISSGEIVNKEFYLNSQRIPDDNGFIYLNPYEMSSDEAQTLELKLQLTSGTKSLAEFLGGEKTDLSFSYLIKYVNSDVEINIEQRINANNHLEIYWNKPEIEGAEIQSYQVYGYNNLGEILVETITDPNKTSFEDKDYVYGAKTYKIVTKYKSAKIADKENYYSVVYNELSKDKFNTSSKESFKLNISWNNTNNLACKYVLKWNNEIINVEQGSSSVSVERPLFPFKGTLYYQLYILPTDANFSDYENYPSVINYFEETYFGDPTNEYGGSLVYAADVKNNLILMMMPRSGSFGFRAYDKDDLKLVNNATIPYISENITSENIRISPTTGFVSIAYQDQRHNYSDLTQIWVYSDYTLGTILSKLPSDNSPFWGMTDNEKIIIKQQERQTLYAEIYDIKTGKLEAKIAEPKYSSWFVSVISIDGKYLFNYYPNSNQGFYKLYSYNDDKSFSLISEKVNTPIREIIFSTKVKNQVILKMQNNTFEIREVPSLNLIKTIQGQFLSFDAFTGNILYLDKNFATNGQLNVLDADYSKVIYSIKVNDSYYYLYTHLINNNLIIHDYYLNITK